MANLRTPNAKIVKLLEEPFLRFVIVRGVLQYGLLVTVIFSAFTWLSDGTAGFGKITLSTLLVSLGLAGAAWGAAMWLCFHLWYRPSKD